MLGRKIVRKIETIATDVVEQQRKDALVKIMKLLKSKPEQVLPCLHALEQDMFLGRASVADAEEWPSTYMHFHQVPKYWLSALLVELVPNLDDDKMRSIDTADKDGIRQLCEFAFGLRPHSKLPRQALNKIVLANTLKVRFTRFGKRISAAWVKKAINLEGGIDWATHGVYQCEPDATDATRVGGVKHAFRREVKAPPWVGWGDAGCVRLCFAPRVYWCLG